jgi:hypothetical protein
MPPRVFADQDARDRARYTRDSQWRFMERVANSGTIWFCPWDKEGKFSDAVPVDVQVCGLIDGMDLFNWFAAHPDWWMIGEWSDDRYARPVSLTEAGRAALLERDLYDMEPVTGGLVEPGWQATPFERTADSV